MRTINACNKHGLKTWGYFIIGLPGENKQTVRETIDLAKSLPLDIALFHVAMPYAGTEFYFQSVANGWLNTYDWKHFDMNDSVVVGYEDFSPADILAATKQAFREFYLRPRQAWRLLKLMRASGDFGMVWSVARNFLSWIFSRREDRVASGQLEAAPQLTQAVNPEDARKAIHSQPVLEAPRFNPATAKPRATAASRRPPGASPPLGLFRRAAGNEVPRPAAAGLVPVEPRLMARELGAARRF